MNKYHSNSILFNYITIDQIDKIQELHPLVYKFYLDENQKFTRFDDLRSCPDISNDFPCFFYLTDKDKIISTLDALPDKLYMSEKTFPWAWAFALFTDPDYRGKGLATLLVKNMVRVLHERNIAWGGIFSTPVAIRIYQKLGFTFPGYANRYLILKTARPLLDYYLKSKILVSILNIPYCMALHIVLMLMKRPLRPNKFNISVERIDFDRDDLSNKNLPPLFYHTPYHFNDSIEKIRWKIGKKRDIALYFVQGGSTKEYLCYFVLKDREIKEEPIAGKFINFKLMTLMDYGVYNADINTYEALMSTVFNLFWNSDAEVLEVMSSSKVLNSVLKRNGMVKVGKGMSFVFCAPECWQMDQDCVELGNWPLTHFVGNTFWFQ
jgi:GNAT superfamily N-acetyltransferase